MNRNVRSRISDSINEGHEQHDFGTVDSRGRRMGARISYMTIVYSNEERADCDAWYTISPGTYYTFRPHATRDGKPYGASQENRHFTTEAARTEAVARYIGGAERRAVRA